MSHCEKFDFYNSHTQNERIKEFNRIKEKYPTRLPIIIEKGDSEKIEIKRNKYLVPYDIIIGNVLNVIRKNLSIDSEKALFLLIDDSMVSVSSMVSQIYENKKSDDGFLYINYYTEKTFG